MSKTETETPKNHARPGTGGHLQQCKAIIQERAPGVKTDRPQGGLLHLFHKKEGKQKKRAVYFFYSHNSKKSAALPARRTKKT
jgi:hypothetical protein